MDGNTSTLVSRYSISKNVGGTDSSMHNYSYAYDKNGNITAISENGTQKAAYQYNELNELIREDNAYINKSVTYSYDVGGNLISKTEYAYTTGALGAPTAVHSYGYGDSNWKDKLTSYDGSAITYDAIGNPLSYVGGWNFTWQQGRKLATAANGQTSISYKYNADGIRTQKTVNGTATNYYLEGGNISWQTDGTNTIHYTYDSNGDLAYMNLNGNLYYYERNAQNDIIGLVDSNMNEVVTYTYDSWGKLLNIGGSLAGTVGKINPFRYRGYYYDTETGLFYVGSRYYDPNTGRFLNADDTDVLNSGKDHPFQQNLFAYCLNNPVNHSDPSGNWILDVIFLAADVADMIAHPSAAGVGWILLDCVSFADPSGAVASGSHALKAVHAAEEALHAVDEVNHAKKLVNAVRHGNDLRTTKRAIGYALKDAKTHEILKYGETTRGTRRYTQKFYREKSCYMKKLAEGSKREMHDWQHEKILKHKKTYGCRPRMNKSDW